MSKTLSIVLLCIFTVITLFLGVFSFIPDFEVGEYEIYHSPAGLIQKANGFTDSLQLSYFVEWDEDVDNIPHILKTLRSRFRRAYGYYGVNLEFEQDETSNGVGTVTVTIPKTNNAENISEDNILNNVMIGGKVEIVTSSTYSASDVVLTKEHFRSVSVRTYVSGSNTWYLCEVRLNSKGKEAAKSLTDGSTNYYAIDEEVGDSYDWAVYTNGRLQLYNHSREDAKLLASYITGGGVAATFTKDGTPETIQGNGGWIYLIILAVMVVASWIFFIVRYGKLGLTAVLSQTLAVVVFTIFAALVHIEMFNLFTALGTFIAYGFMTFFTYYTYEKIRSYSENKTYASAKYKAFLDANKLNLIAHGALLVLGVILWVIPSIVTAPLGNVLVYGAILSFVVTFGCNRLLANMIAPFMDAAPSKAKAK